MGILLVAQAGKILLKIIAHCISEYFQRADILPDEQSGTEPLYHRYDVRDLSTTGVGVEETNSVAYMVY